MALMNKPKEPRKTSKLEEKIKTAGRYTLVSFLPGKVQEKIARKHGEDVIDYWGASTFTEVLIGGGMTMVGIAFPPLAIPGLVLMGDSAINAFRGFTYDHEYKGCSGHPITTIPYHLVKQPYNYVKKKINPKKIKGEKN